MGVKSTFSIPRDIALQVIKRDIDTLSNNDLACILEMLPQSDYRNYSIDGKDVENRTIKTVYEFETKHVFPTNE
jgi:hypothetical protein